MDFRVLGPIEVSRDGALLDLRGAKQRVLLGALLARPDEVVPVDQLIEALWGDDPPNSAANALQVHVSNLRRLIEREGDPSDGRLLTRSPGYVVRVGDELDSVRFATLAEQGAQALRSDKPELASRKLREALSLWRGPAFADLMYEPFFQATVAALAEAQRAALHDRIEADLALGRHAELVGELEGLVGDHPLDEGFRSLLMLALYRCGRQAEALACARDTAKVFAEELGIDPGPDLARLERSILNHDPGLDLPERGDLGQRVGQVTRAERRTVSVLITDLSNLVAGGDDVDPEDLWTSLLPMHELLVREVEPFGGLIIRAIGDTVSVVFGATVEHGDEAVRAVRAAVHAQGAIAAATDRSDATTGRLRIAVATGVAVFDPLAGEGRGLVVGDVVNTAFRLFEQAAIGSIVVDEATYQRTSGPIVYEPLAPVLIETRSTPIAIWRAVDATDTPAGEPRSVLVGRGSELRLLRSIWERVVDQRAAHLVTIVGPAGIGKSRLAHETSATVDGLGGRVVVGRSLPYGEGTGYGAFAQQVRSIAGIHETDKPTAAREKLAVLLESVVADDERTSIVEHLELMLGLAADGSVADRQVLFHAARRLVEGLSAERPTLFVFEDIHWADPTLVDLVESLAARVRDTPAMFLALTRPEFFERRPGWGGGTVPSTVLPVEPLEHADADRLARQLVAGGDPSLAAGVAARSEGNPLFIEELAAAKAEHLGDAPADLPETIRAAIGARLDALPSEARSVLMDAAVVGRVFWQGALPEPAGASLADVLETLEARNLIRREPVTQIEGDRQFIFKHALIREVAYGLLPRALRRERHIATARFIERTAGDRLAQSASLLGYHWAEAGDVDKAVEYLILAAGYARRGWAKSEAVSLYDRALELLPPGDPAEAGLHLQRAFALMEDGDYRSAAEALDRLIPDLADRDLLEALLARTKAAVWLTDADAVRAFGRRAARFAEELGDPSLSAPALGYVSQIAGMEGRPADMIEIGEKALGSWPAGELPHELAYELELVGLSQTWIGRFADAEINLRASYAISEESRSVEAMLRSGATLGLALSGLGRHEEAFGLFDETIRQGRDLELLPRFTGRALNMSSAAYRDLFDLGEARRRNEEAIELGRLADFSLVTIQAGIDLLLADLAEGEFGRAGEAWQPLWEATADTHGFHQWLMTGRLLAARAEIDLALADTDTAAASARASIEHARKTQRPKQEVIGQIVLAETMVASGRGDDARVAAESSTSLAASMANPPLMLRAFVAAGRIFGRIGGDDAADAAYGEARAVVDGFAAELSEEHRRSFLSAPDALAALDGGR